MIVGIRIPRPDGAHLQVQVSGPPDAPALVLLQGQANSHDWWSGLRVHYEDHFRTITMDYRGTGMTTSPPGELSMALLGSDVIAVLDALGLEPWFALGTDKIVYDPDGWTIRSADGSRTAHSEHTIAITDDAPLVLTRRAA
ncbi:MAG: alpha/beta fold hydrolase [Mycobacteriaceae bacterium]|nr:alpha/beta fold hydrolase [Mycobacteriaceae bacterium]